MKAGTFAAKAAKAHVSVRTFQDRVLTNQHKYDEETINQAKARRDLFNWGSRKSTTLV